ncbi:DNA polymerase III subunit beta [Candidatus Hydrogenedentota bacterium]
MKFTLTQTDLQSAIARVYNTVSGDGIKPILSGILIEAEEDRISLSSTDLKIGIETVIPANVVSQGVTVVSGAKLHAIVRELPSQEVTISLSEDNTIKIECAKIFFSMLAMSAEEFPTIPTFQKDKEITLPQALLRDMIGKTSFAISREEPRHTLQGLYFDFVKKELKLVATDGRKLALCKTQLEQEISVTSFILPEKAVLELGKQLGGEGDVSISTSENQVSFKFDGTLLTSRLIEGNFPNYDLVIPKNQDKELLAQTTSVMSGLRRASVMTNPKHNVVRFTVMENMVILNSTAPEAGGLREEMEVEYRGESLELGLNPSFFMEILRHITTDNVLLQIKDNVSPSIIRPHSENDDLLYVLMPIRLEKV